MKKIYTILGIVFLWTIYLEAKIWKVPSEVPTIKSAVEDSAQYCIRSNVNIRGNKIVHNGDAYRGAGICCDSSSNGIIKDNLIKDNWTESGWGIAYGAGIYCGLSNPVILNNLITRNVIDVGSGGGIYCDSSSAMLINNTIDSNIGGGIAILGASSPIIKVTWDGGDRFGKRVPSGIYFCVMKAGDSKVVRKLVVLR